MELCSTSIHIDIYAFCCTAFNTEYKAFSFVTTRRQHPAWATQELSLAELLLSLPAQAAQRGPGHQFGSLAGAFIYAPCGYLASP